MAASYDLAVSEPAHVKRMSRFLAALRELPDPLRRLDAARHAREEVERVELDAVAASRGAGKTWTEIGQLYGLTKQGAQQRFQRADRTMNKKSNHHHSAE